MNLAAPTPGREATLQAAARRLREATSVMALTGAGISVPSGIPDFRAPDGLWTRFNIMEYATIFAFRSNPERVWQMFAAVEESVAQARPNPAHFALAELEAMGRLHCLVTQNIDGLHQAAGSRNVQEFHGGYQHFSCLFCGGGATPAEAAARKDVAGIPRCDCGKPLKPDVVLFGEGIPDKALKRSFAAAHEADVILVIGTSAQVAPASELPQMVASRGGTVIEMNLTSTELTDMATFHIEGDVAQTLPQLVSLVKAL